MPIRSGESSHSVLPTMPSRRLRLILREEEECDNLFVRLSSAIAFDLYLLARRQPHNEPSVPYPRESGDTWNLFDEESFNSISFLPLCIAVGDSTILASYNGGSCVSSTDQDVIEVPRSMISGTSNVLPKFVSVHALSRIDYGVRVLVEPATIEDWELLEIHSNFMEEGGILSQVSVIYPNQQLTIRVDGIDRVQILVKEVTTKASSMPGDAHLIWPDISSYCSVFGEHSDDTLSNSHNLQPQCVLLLRDTEMIIEPKTRPRTKNTPWLDPFRLIPSDVDWGSSFTKLSSLTGRGPFHVEPGCVLVKTEQWPFGSEWAQLRPENSNQIRVVRVITSSRIPRNHAVLFIGTRFDLHLCIHCDSIRLRPLAFTLVIPFEQIELEEICLEHDQGSMPTWNVPNINLANSILEGSISTFYCRINRSSFPVGAVMPIPPDKDSKERQRLDRWARIVSKEAHSYGAGYFVQLDVNDISLLLKRRLRKCNRFFSTIVAPRISTIQIPRKISFSSDWTKSILDCMKHFGSIVVTLRGVRGSGKTYSAILLSTLGSFYFHRPVFYLDCKKLQKLNPRINGILEEIDTLSSKALKTRNSIIVLDDLDSLSPNLFGVEETDVSERTHTVNPVAIDQSKLIADRLSDLFKAVVLRGNSHEDGHFFLIATCSSTTSINPSIFKSSQVPFICTKVPPLSVEDRADILMEMVHRHNPMCCLSFVLTDISRRTEGFLPCDFEKLSLRALRSYKTNSSITSLQDSLVAELADFTPVAQISNVKDQYQFHASWADIGGLFEVKETLESIVRHPLVYRGIYTRARMQLPRGILLYGPSGCGKSYLVPALARKCGYPLITCKGPEVLDKYIGASEAKVRKIFERALQMAPSILFLDELEALAPRRGSDSTGVTDRVVNQLLTFLDGVEDVSSGTVFIIGATSRPDKVDPALIRPGRLERHLYIGPPKSTNEWSDLLIKIAKSWNLSAESRRALSVGEAIVDMAIDKPRLCPADVRAAFDTAHLNAVHRTLDGNILGGDVKMIEIDSEDITFGLRETNPSLCENEGRLLRSIYDSFRGNRSNVNPDPRGKSSQLKTSLR